MKNISSVYMVYGWGKCVYSKNISLACRILTTLTRYLYFLQRKVVHNLLYV